jgi:hypothetical protein
LWAIPVAAGKEVILTAIGHLPVLTGKTVNHVTGPVLRPRTPAISVPGRAPDPALVVGVTIIGARVVTAAVPTLIATPVRGLGLLHCIWTRLNRQVITGLDRARLNRGCALWTPLPLTAMRLRILL